MRATAIVTAAVLLAGCQSIEHLQATVGNASNFQLCRAIFLAPPDVAGIAREEAGRRSLDCRPYAAAILQNEQASDAAVQNFIRSTQPAPMRPSVNCQTVRIGDTLQTHCR